jgi:hypothetical protein
MSRQYFALWKNRNGQQLWDGPFPTNTRAMSFLDMILDKTGGYMVATTIPMTPAEVREAPVNLRGDDDA